MKRTPWLGGLVVGLVMVFCGGNVFAHDSGDIWSRKTQWEKDNAIVNKATSLIGQYGGQCKEWVQMSVVKPASNNHVLLPLNNPAPYDWYWQYDTTGHAVGYGTYLEWVGYGDIIQMRLKNGMPHTMIVVWNMGSGLWVVDSNSQLDEMVRYYYISFSELKGKLEHPWSFSVYYVR